MDSAQLPFVGTYRVTFHLIGFICKNRACTGKHAYNKACYVTNPERPLTDITAEIKRTLRRSKPEDDWAHFDVPALVSEELSGEQMTTYEREAKAEEKPGKQFQHCFERESSAQSVAT